MDNIDHLSYSTAKKIYRKGVDYAVGTKLGLINESFGKAADLGIMAHAMVLGGDPNWIVSPFSDFRTKEAREWKAAQSDIIITENDFAQITKIANAIVAHPLAKNLLDSTKHEQELTATIDGLNFLGYADGISEDRNTLFDVKTTGQFDDFKWQVFKKDYDLQASIYRLFAKDPTKAKYYFIVAESVEPYRVQLFGTSQEFFGHGDEKLSKTIAAFKEFRARPGKSDLEKINFNIGETDSLINVEELGDWSL